MVPHNGEFCFLVLSLQRKQEMKIGPLRAAFTSGGGWAPAFPPRPRAGGSSRPAEHAVNSVVVLVFCLFPWNGLMDVNNYQTIKASKCAIFYRSKSSNK